MHWVLWCIHGCPRGLNVVKKFTTGHLAKKCWQAGYPLLLSRDVGDAKVLDFIQGHSNLVIVLGDLVLNRELLSLPPCGLVRAAQDIVNEPGKAGVQIRLEYFAKGAETPHTVASLNVPSQPYDGLMGQILNTDLIADDLFVETASVL